MTRRGRWTTGLGLAGMSVGHWRASDGENCDVRLQLVPKSRDTGSDLSQLPLVLGSPGDGSARRWARQSLAASSPHRCSRCGGGAGGLLLAR